MTTQGIRRSRLHVPGSLFIALLTMSVFAGQSHAGNPAPPHAPILKSGSEHDYPPFCSVDADGGATGFSVELMRAAVEAMGRDVAFRTGPWEEVKGWLERGEVDALPLVGRAPEREQVFDFTFPYMSLHGAVVVRAGTKDIHNLGDLRGKRVAVMKDDNAEEFLRREDRGIEIRTTPTFEDALRELAEGHHDAVVIQRLVALRLINEKELTNLVIVNRPIEDFRQDFCFAVREGDRDTLALLNEGLALVMADGTYRHLHAKWFAALELPVHRRIVIGGDHNFPPYEYLDENGRPAGYNVELTRAIAGEMGMDVDIRLGAWTEIIKALEAGEIDAVQGMFYSPDRDLKFDFSNPHTVNLYVSVARAGTGTPPAEVSELAGKRIVVQAGDIMHDYAVKNGLQSQLTVVESQEDALQGVAEGSYDCALVARMTAVFLIKKHGWQNLTVGQHPFLSPEYCYAVSQSQRPLLAQLNEGLSSLKQRGDYRRLHEKWFGVRDGLPLDATGFLRYAVIIVGPLMLILSGSFLWSWSLRKQVALRTEELRQSEELQRAMIACSPLPIFTLDLEGRVVTWNASAERVFGWAAEEAVGKPPPTVPQGGEEEFRDLRDLVLSGQEFSGREVVRQRKGGELLTVSLSAAPIHDASGRIFGIMCSVEDITERKRAEQALRESEAQFRAIFDVASVGIVQVDPRNGQMIRYNRKYREITGYSDEELRAVRFAEITHPDDRERDWEIFSMAARGETPDYHNEKRYVRKDGSIVWVRLSASFIRDEFDRPIRTVAICEDISERKLAEEEREKLQAQVLQIQKMESVGRLAGGVAHDYNNMLGVIIGYAELALDKIGPDESLHSDLNEILKAAKRSRDITRQLLAFARKQTIAPVVLDLNRTVEGMLNMLRRLIGEDIDLAWMPKAGLWRIRMDPAQLDQILANLCVNARDAISGVGKITIETTKATFDEAYCADHPGFIPGEFVILAVSDDGCGMDRETLSSIFEPFFTTKGVDEGTGLGLATVYGIVKQNDGFINVYSEPGKGTTFKVCLPRHAREAPGEEAVSEAAPLYGEGETVLLVEDEPAILRMVTRMLEKLGYGVLAANGPREAIELAGKHAGQLHLLITDVVMPEMNGRDLAHQLMSRYPDLRLLFMSGYTANVIAHRGVLDEGVHFIHKPFSLQEFADKIKDVLE